MWKVYNRIVASSRHGVVFYPSPYCRAIEILMGKLGDFVSVGRRKTPPFIVAIEKSLILAKMYVIARDLILFGRHRRNFYHQISHSHGIWWVRRTFFV